MVGGSSKKNTDSGMNWLKEHPDESREVMDRLTTVVIEYLDAQINAGVHMVQVFEAMCEHIDEPNFHEFAVPCLERIAREIKARHPDVPLLGFARDAGQYGLEALQKAGYDVMTVDRAMSGDDARVPRGGGGARGGRRRVRCRATSTLICFTRTPPRGGRGGDRGGGAGHDGQVRPAEVHRQPGFGTLMGTEDPAKVDFLVNTIHKVSEEMIAANE